MGLTTDIQFRYLSWNDVEKYCGFIHSKMLSNQYQPNAIIGLLRGGVIPARIFSDYFNILLDFFALDVKLYNGVNKTRDKPVIGPFSLNSIKGRKILLLDDIYDSGRTMEAVLEYLKGEDITTATLLWKETAPKKPDYYAQIAEKNTWIIFPWEKHEFETETQKT